MILSVNELRTQFFLRRGIVKAVDGVSFQLLKGETLGLVGESGCGKTITALSIMRLIPSPPGRIVSGQIAFQGINLLELSEEEMRKYRGGQIAMIFQDPTAALNPVYTIGDQIGEVVRLHQGMSKQEVKKKVVELLETVDIPSAYERVHDYPHQLSGGMRQRAMIAMAVACNPSLLIADEPTTNLDVTIQAQILELMKSLRQESGSAILLITHDLGVVAEMCDRVAVMYAGEIVEYADTMSIFHDTKHPYTQSLMNCIPRRRRGMTLISIEGNVPDLIAPPSGCRFHPRCPKAFDLCSKVKPELQDLGQGHLVACHLYG